MTAVGVLPRLRRGGPAGHALDRRHKEPRFLINDGLKTQQVFGRDVIGSESGADRDHRRHRLGYPLESLKDVRRGTYTVQALLHRDETFHRADGHVVKLPMDRGEGPHWNLAPGNLYSTPRKVTIDPAGAGRSRSRWTKYGAIRAGWAK